MKIINWQSIRYKFENSPSIKLQNGMKTNYIYYAIKHVFNDTVNDNKPVYNDKLSCLRFFYYN